MKKKPEPAPEATLAQIRARGVPAIASWRWCGRRMLVIGTAGPTGRMLAGAGTGPAPGVDLRKPV